MSRLPLILQLALGAIALNAIWCLLLYALQERLIFPRPPYDAVARPPADAEIWHLDAPGGPVEAWFFGPPSGSDAPSPDASSPAALIAHGNAELIDTFPEEFRRFRDLGMAVLMVEYPGYGRSAGRPSQSSIAEALGLAYDRLVARPDIDASRVVLFGRSLGGGAVCALAQRRSAAGLILLSTFRSLEAMTRRYMAPVFLLRHPFDNVSALRAYPGPVLILHSGQDRLIPYDHAVALRRAAPNGTLVTLADCGHADCPRDWDEFWKEVAAFLRDAGIAG